MNGPKFAAPENNLFATVREKRIIPRNGCTATFSAKAAPCVWIVIKRLVNAYISCLVSALITMQPVSCLSRCTTYLSHALTSNLIGGPGADFDFSNKDAWFCSAEFY
jgi:hypothetical protein